MKTCTSRMSGFALMLGVLVGGSRASADVVNTWVFTPGASTILGGDIELISGSFTFNSATDTESGVSITLTGQGPFAGNYTEPLMEGFVGDTIVGFAPNLELSITFLDPLTAANSPDAIGMVVWTVVPETRASPPIRSTGSFGSAVIVTPEPGSVGLLGVVVGILMWRRLRVGAEGISNLRRVQVERERQRGL